MDGSVETSLSTKPRLAPKPFSLQKNNTIRSIHAPRSFSAKSKPTSNQSGQVETGSVPKTTLSTPAQHFTTADPSPGIVQLKDELKNNESKEIVQKRSNLDSSVAPEKTDPVLQTTDVPKVTPITTQKAPLQTPAPDPKPSPVKVQLQDELKLNNESNIQKKSTPDSSVAPEKTDPVLQTTDVPKVTPITTQKAPLQTPAPDPKPSPVKVQLQDELKTNNESRENIQKKSIPDSSVPPGKTDPVLQTTDVPKVTPITTQSAPLQTPAPESKPSPVKVQLQDELKTNNESKEITPITSASDSSVALGQTDPAFKTTDVPKVFPITTQSAPLPTPAPDPKPGPVGVLPTDKPNTTTETKEGSNTEHTPDSAVAPVKTDTTLQTSDVSKATPSTTAQKPPQQATSPVPKPSPVSVHNTDQPTTARPDTQDALSVASAKSEAASEETVTKEEPKSSNLKQKDDSSVSPKPEESGHGSPSTTNPTFHWGGTRRRLPSNLTSKFESGGPPVCPQPIIPVSTSPNKDNVNKPTSPSPEPSKATPEPSNEKNNEGELIDDSGGGSIKRRISRLFDSSVKPEVVAKKQEPDVITTSAGVKERIKNWVVDTSSEAPKPQGVTRSRSKSVDSPASPVSEKTDKLANIQLPETVTPSTQAVAPSFQDSPVEQPIKTPVETLQDDAVEKPLVRTPSLPGEPQQNKSVEAEVNLHDPKPSSVRDALNEGDPGSEESPQRVLKRKNVKRRSVRFGFVEMDDGGPPIMLESESEEEEPAENKGEEKISTSMPVYRSVGSFLNKYDILNKEEEQEKQSESEKAIVNQQAELKLEEERKKQEEKEREKKDEIQKEEIRRKEEEKQREEKERQRLREEELERQKKEEQENERLKEEKRKRQMELIRQREIEEERERIKLKEEQLRKDQEEREKERLKEEERQRAEAERKRMKELEDKLREEEIQLKKQKEEDEQKRREKELELMRQRQKEEERERARQIEERLRQDEMERLKKEVEEKEREARRKLEEEEKIKARLRQEEEERRRRELEAKRLEEEEIERMRRVEEARKEQERTLEKEKMEELERKLKVEESNLISFDSEDVPQKSEKLLSPLSKPVEPPESDMEIVFDDFSVKKPDMDVDFEDFSVKPRRWGTKAKVETSPAQVWRDPSDIVQQHVHPQEKEAPKLVAKPDSPEPTPALESPEEEDKDKPNEKQLICLDAEEEAEEEEEESEEEVDTIEDDSEEEDMQEFLGGKLSAAQQQVAGWVGSVRRSLQGALDLVWGNTEEEPEDDKDKNEEEEESEDREGRFQRAMSPLRSFARRSRQSLRNISIRSRQRRTTDTRSTQLNSYCVNSEDKDTDALIDSVPDQQNGFCEQPAETESTKPVPEHVPEASSEEVDTTAAHSEPECTPFPESATPLLDTSAQRSKADLSRRLSRTKPSRSLRLANTKSSNWRVHDSTDENELSTKQEDSEPQQKQPKLQKVSSPSPTSKGVPSVPGGNPAALIAQLKKRSVGGAGKGDAKKDVKQSEEKEREEVAASPSQLPRSPRNAAHLAGAALVLPPLGSSDSGTVSSPAWLKELKSKKRLSQYDSES